MSNLVLNQPSGEKLDLFEIRHAYCSQLGPLSQLLQRLPPPGRERRLGTPTRAMLRRLATARSLRVAAASAAASAAGTLAYTSCDASSWSPASYPLALAPPVVASKPGRLQGRSAIVTGAASGMGAASAKLFAAEGAKVAVVDVNGEGAEKVAADIRAAGGDAIGVACDLTDEAQVKAAVKFIEGTYGPCNALFNHAGGLVVKDFLKISLKEWYGLSTL